LPTFGTTIIAAKSSTIFSANSAAHYATQSSAIVDAVVVPDIATLLSAVGTTIVASNYSAK
jgi:hypothetical protein